MRLLDSEEGIRMDNSESTFPMDGTDPSSRPWKFRPGGYLVVILASSEEARRAEGTLVAHGFAARDIKLYTGKQILDNQVEYISRRRLTSKVLSPLIEDVEGRELYLGYAREDRAAMWVRIPDEGEVPKALRVLADHDYLHTRYYGSGEQTDYHLS
jgi:hypothetical protein